MPDEPSLLDLQHQLESLFSLGGTPDYEGRLEADAPALPIRGDERLSAAERIGIYTAMIFARIRDAIAEDFWCTAQLLGDDWEPLIARYLEAHPTRHADLRLAGRNLPAFVRATQRTPLADLADLEWALIDSFTAADAPILRAEALQALAPEAWPALALEAVPSLRLCRPTSSCDRTRRRMLEGEEAALESEEAFPLRIWRTEFRVFQKRIDEFEFGALKLVAGGTTFAELCTWIAEQETTEGPSEAAVRLLQLWLADELLSCGP
ncbi:MAG: putative DNA-binding domain-containing protein [Candidatus Binatia bacterium]|nr:putative DNA-binding domain-containing protein [Candidatus Binatia bacterium]